MAEQSWHVASIPSKGGNILLSVRKAGIARLSRLGGGVAGLFLFIFSTQFS